MPMRGSWGKEVSSQFSTAFLKESFESHRRKSSQEENFSCTRQKPTFSHNPRAEKPSLNFSVSFKKEHTTPKVPRGTSKRVLSPEFRTIA
jgi:hypothetical protein